MKKIVALILVSVMIISLCACGSSKTGQAPAASDIKTVGITVPGNSLERFSRDGQYLKEEFEAAGYEVILSYSETDEQQNLDIKDMIGKGADLLIILAVDCDGLSETLAEAKEKNIPVVDYDRLINDTDALTVYVSFDIYGVGALQGSYVKEALDLDNAEGPFNIEFAAGSPGDTNSIYYVRGAVDVLKPYIDSGKLVTPSGQTSFEQVATEEWSAAKAEERFKGLLESYYSDGTVLDAVVCSNDSTALGVTNAIRECYKGSNVPVITGQDGDIANLRNIVDGIQAMTVYKNVSDEAAAALEVSKAILEGKSLDDKLAGSLQVEASFDTTTYNNGAMSVPSYLLVPVSVTAKDLDLLVKTGLYQWDAAHSYLEAVK